MKLISTLIFVLSFNLVANEVKKDTKKVTEKKAVGKEGSKEADCDKPKDEFLKKIEAQKKAQAEAGKGFSLQGSKDTGCSL
ncbi:MAG: hypothetical protein HOP07_04690 [Bacteriovoracaceae bacterium]|nr:hypothetical protein [Bacteriovoracaceae bacterium]